MRPAPAPTPVHPITTYRKKHKLTPAAFCELVGADRTSLSKVENAQRDRLAPDVNLAIEAKTNGALTVQKLMTWRWPAELKKAGGLRPRERRAEARLAATAR